MKYNKGDIVVCLKSIDKQFTEGKEYIVKSHDAYTVCVESDDRGSTTNGWDQQFFKLKERRMAKKTEVNFLILGNSMVLNYEGKTVTLPKDDGRYAKALQAIKEDRLTDIPGLVEIERSFNGSGIELKDGILHAEGAPIPTELNARILDFKAQGLPYAPLLKFWENLKKNPSFNARQMLFKFLEHNGVPLTKDGFFIAYRGVSQDFKDKHTGKFDNKPGSICEMARELVDDNPNNTCSTGLHVACFDYAKGFGERTVEVKVNPADVVAVPTDYNGTKMRVCRFEVVQECIAMRTELVTGTKGEKYESELDEDEQEETEEVGYNPNYRHAVRNKSGRFTKSK